MNYRFHGPKSALVSLTFFVGAVLAGCGGGGGSDSPAATTASAPATAPPVPSAPPSPVNTAPQLSGAVISSVAADSLYTFMPAASDSDNDPLTFEIQNKPSWATFSTVNGKLLGTPTAAQSGTYANIMISASDGKAVASLPSFSITVTKPTLGTATLAWSAPTQNIDGSSLADLAGFTIVYGKTQAALDQTVRIDNAGVSEYMVQSLPAGTYYFAVKSFNAAGAESALSNVVSKVIG